MADDRQLSLYSKYCSQTDILFVLWNPVRCFKLRINKISIKAIYGLVFQKVFPVWDTKLYTPRKNIKKTLSLKSNHIFFFKMCDMCGFVCTTGTVGQRTTTPMEIVLYKFEKNFQKP